MESVEERLVERLQHKFGGNPTLEDPLAFVGVDSVSMADLTVELEKEFGIQVDDGIVVVETVQELADYIRRHQAASGE